MLLNSFIRMSGCPLRPGPRGRGRTTARGRTAFFQVICLSSLLYVAAGFHDGSVPEVRGLGRRIGPVLGLEYDGGFQHFHRVPRSRGYLAAGGESVGAEAVAGRFAQGRFASGQGLFGVEHLVEAALQAEHRLGGAVVAVDGHGGPGLQGVEHSLALVGGRGAHVKALAKAGRAARLVEERAEEVLGKFHGQLLGKASAGALCRWPAVWGRCSVSRSGRGRGCRPSRARRRGRRRSGWPRWPVTVP